MGVDADARLVYGFEVSENDDLAQACDVLGIDWRAVCGLDDSATSDDMTSEESELVLEAIAEACDIEFVSCCSYAQRYYVLGIVKAVSYGDDGGVQALSKRDLSVPGKRRLAKLNRVAKAFGVKSGWLLTVYLSG